MTEEEKAYWFCFSFRGKTLSTCEQCEASTYTGYPSKDITLAIIKDNKRNAGVTPDSILISVAYLGYMTPSEFKG